MRCSHSVVSAVNRPISVGIVPVNPMNSGSLSPNPITTSTTPVNQQLSRHSPFAPAFHIYLVTKFKNASRRGREVEVQTYSVWHVDGLARQAWYKL